MNTPPEDYIKGKADVFSFVLDCLNKRGAAGVAFTCGDILTEILTYVNLPYIIQPTEHYILGVIDGYDHFTEYFSPYSDVIEMDKIKYIIDGVEADLEQLIHAMRSTKTG
jgi:hypothetical protein